MKIKEGGYYRETSVSRAYHGATWATAQAQSTPVARIRRWVRRAWGRFVMRVYHAARWLMLAALVALALVIAAGGGR